jgi:hypothetical protein
MPEQVTGDASMVKIAITEFEAAAPVDDAAAMAQFQKQWATYQKLVDFNALSHREVAAELHRTLAAVPRAFSFLDIACGDAGQMPEALGRTKVSHYHGLDLSEPALQLAARNLADMPFQVDLEHCDFVQAIEARGEPADIAWCGLSIHHLSTEAKLALLKAVRGSTTDLLMIYEPTLQPGEDRDAYLVRFRRVNRPAWTFLDDAEWSQIDNHVTQCDLPETAQTWLELGREAGFAQARDVFSDPTGFYRIYRYDV